MWLLRKINSDGPVLYLVSWKKSYAVGRKNGDLVIPDDSSVSRNHCSIKIGIKEVCPFPVRTPTGVWIIDEGSKYGTYIQSNNEWQQVTHMEAKLLLHGSVIRFGIMENIWRLEYKPVVACTSGIMGQEKIDLKRTLNSIDGELINNWARQCSVLFVKKISLTEKVVLALINGVPIVTTKYLDQIVDSVKNHTKWPNYMDCKPEIAEVVLKADQVSLNIQDNRKELFKGKKFMLPTKNQLESLKGVISAAGGSFQLIEFNGKYDFLRDDNIIVIQLPVDLDAQLHQSIGKKFQEMSHTLQTSYDKRVVPESEIPQAVAYSSIEKYCNPKCHIFEIRKSKVESFSKGSLLVDESEERFMREQEFTGKVIPSSMTCLTPDLQGASGIVIDEDPSTSSHRKRPRSPEQPSISKRVASSRDKVRDTFEKPSTPCNSKSEKDQRNSLGSSQTVLSCDTISKKQMVIEETASTSRSTSKNDGNNVDPFWRSVLEPEKTDQGKRKPSVDVDQLIDDNDGTSYVKKRRISKDVFGDDDRTRQTKKQETPKTSSSSRTLDASKPKEVPKETQKVLPERVKRTEKAITKTAEEDDENFISVDRKPHESSKSEHGDLLNSTIIMLAMVTLANPVNRRSPQPGLKNVKKFKKQRVVATGPRVLATDSLKQEEDDDGAWISTESSLRFKTEPDF